MTQTLSQSDIEELMHNRTSPDIQVRIVEKLAGQYNSEGTEGLNKSETDVANSIFGLLMKSAEAQVRAVMAANLGKSNRLPVDIVRSMAQDVEEVATPVLEQSPLLSDEDLLDIISSSGGDVGKLEAIARREAITENISDALVDTQIISVVKTVVLNEGAEISEKTFEKIAERHSDSTEVMESFFSRSYVPPVIVEKVMERISDGVRQQLEKKLGNLIERQELQRMFEQSMELTSLKMLGFRSDDRELLKVLDHLDGSNKLTPFSALSMANLQLFEVSLSRLLRIPFRNVQALIRDGHGLRKAYLSADLPEFLFDATALAVRAILDIEGNSTLPSGMKQIISPQQLMEHMKRLSAGQDVPGAEYLYALMQQSMRKQLAIGGRTA